jgi:hypothetical protein
LARLVSEMNWSAPLPFNCSTLTRLKLPPLPLRLTVSVPSPRLIARLAKLWPTVRKSLAAPVSVLSPPEPGRNTLLMSTGMRSVPLPTRKSSTVAPLLLLNCSSSMLVSVSTPSGPEIWTSFGPVTVTE